MNNDHEYLQPGHNPGLKHLESLWNGFPLPPDDELSGLRELRHQLGSMPLAHSNAVKSVLSGAPLGEDIVLASSAMESAFRPAQRHSLLDRGSPFGGGGFDPFR